MLSKFKITSCDENSLSVRFRHNRAKKAEPEQLPLIDVYEAEIRRLREENENLKLQHNSVVLQLTAALTQLQQANAEIFQLKQHIAQTETASNFFYHTKKNFWQLTKAARNNKKRRVRQLVIQSVMGLEEFVPLEVCCLLYSFFSYLFKKNTALN